MIDVTVVILTKNEEVNLPDCIRSVEGFAKRVVVVDSYSDDRTEEIAREMGPTFTGTSSSITRPSSTGRSTTPTSRPNGRSGSTPTSA